MIKRKHYLSPECEYEDTISEGILCESPETGGLEDVEYDDWEIS